MDGEEKKLEALINNEVEWRRHIMKTVDEIKKEQSGMIVVMTELRLKSKQMGAFFGMIGGAIVGFIFKKL